jgi:hypothetical protein
LGNFANRLRFFPPKKDFFCRNFIFPKKRFFLPKFYFSEKKIFSAEKWFFSAEKVFPRGMIIGWQLSSRVFICKSSVFCPFFKFLMSFESALPYESADISFINIPFRMELLGWQLSSRAFFK